MLTHDLCAYVVKFAGGNAWSDSSLHRFYGLAGDSIRTLQTDQVLRGLDGHRFSLP